MISYVSSVDGIAGGFTIANGVIIENATGGSADDMVKVGGGHDTLLSGRGADAVKAGTGS